MFASHLDTRIDTDAVDQVPSRNGYGEGLLAAGEADDRIVALCADLTESTRTHHFRDAFPERFIQVGIAEQNMASVASGMAAMGRVPFIASYAIFSPGRNWEQIRTTIAYNNVNVKIVGAHAGVSVGPDGATHQAIEDVAIMRVVPNMTVISPADAVEAKKATMAAAKHDGPVYMRIGREKTPVVTTDASPFVIGTGQWFMQAEGTADSTEMSVGIVVTGTLAHTALVAAKRLVQSGHCVSVVHMPTIKPLDTDILTELLMQHAVIVTVEEHQRVGGLGSAVAEFSAETNPKPVLRIGVDDQFGQSGTPDELLIHYGLDADTIVSCAVKWCAAR